MPVKKEVVMAIIKEIH
ncbi:hypothetical protein M8C21_003429 [Ambrosia artemisiifolia]|uniref:Uncharacterized protein n=1 Tax=Ambrosia artemisiifolia TaxID=4212 RepID=A0AAD5BQ97_AMBAR|nr:hypothetical protein M8C21_003429 [Ambrosia artemisiifolia]